MWIFNCANFRLFSLAKEALEDVSRQTTTRDDVSGHTRVPGLSSQFEDQ